VLHAVKACLRAALLWLYLVARMVVQRLACLEQNSSSGRANGVLVANGVITGVSGMCCFCWVQKARGCCSMSWSLAWEQCSACVGLVCDHQATCASACRAHVLVMHCYCAESSWLSCFSS
jgi:hypothetical protein